MTYIYMFYIDDTLKRIGIDANHFINESRKKEFYGLTVKQRSDLLQFGIADTEVSTFKWERHINNSSL